MSRLIETQSISDQEIILNAKKLFPTTVGVVRKGTFSGKLLSGEITGLDLPVIIENENFFLNGKWRRDKIKSVLWNSVHLVSRDLDYDIGTRFYLRSKNMQLRGILEVYFGVEGNLPIQLRLRKMGSEYNFFVGSHFIYKQDVLTGIIVPEREYVLSYRETPKAIEYLRGALSDEYL